MSRVRFPFLSLSLYQPISAVESYARYAYMWDGLITTIPVGLRNFDAIGALRCACNAMNIEIQNIFRTIFLFWAASASYNAEKSFMDPYVCQVHPTGRLLRLKELDGRWHGFYRWKEGLLAGRGSAEFAVSRRDIGVAASRNVRQRGHRIVYEVAGLCSYKPRVRLQWSCRCPAVSRECAYTCTLNLRRFLDICENERASFTDSKWSGRACVDAPEICFETWKFG